MNIYIGIDPGLKGGIAILDKNVTVFPMPINKNGIDAMAVLDILFDNIFYTGEKFVVIEKVHAMPKQGVSSMFTFGKGYGAIIATIELLGLPYQLVTPQAWQKEICAGIPGEPKQRAAIAARRLFPDVNLKATPRCKKNHDGMVDALLIAEYGKRKGF